MKLTLEEQETIINMNASDRTQVAVFSDDPVMQRRIEKVGYLVVKENRDGSKEYTLDAKQILIRATPKGRKMSDEEKAELAERLRKGKENKSAE